MNEITTDIVGRLRKRADLKYIRDYPFMADPLIGEAADEIARLRAALHETVLAIKHVQAHLINNSHPQDVVMNNALAAARNAWRLA